MSTFEVGKSYYATSACDHNCVFVVEIVKRTAKTVTFRRDGQERRAKIYADHNGEYIVPERYSMAPVFRASCEYVEDQEEVEEAAPADPFVCLHSPGRPALRAPRPGHGRPARDRELWRHVPPRRSA